VSEPGTVRIAHLSDLHLGFRQYYRLTPQGINQREADVAQAFRAAVSDVIAAEPDLVLIAGDLFHSVRPANPAILDAFNQLRRLRQALAHTPVIVIAGDHDTPRSVETGTILRLFEAIEGVHVVVHDARRLVFEPLGLSVLCVPWAALGGETPVELAPDPAVARNVLLLHGEIGGLPREYDPADYGVPVLELADLNPGRWDYVALGHYHVARAMAPNAWYAGALDYVGRNPWGELKQERALGREGRKGWLLVRLGGAVQIEFRPVRLARQHIDLRPIAAAGLDSAELDARIAAQVAEVEGGIDQQVVRQLVYDVPRLVARELNHEAIREYRNRALHYHLDLRRPEPRREVGVGAPGGRGRTLGEIVIEYLERRPLPPGMERAALTALGRRYMEQVEREGIP
jgi:hypothetical protein